MTWHLGDRVEQPTYGAGTIIEITDQHVVVHFDSHGRRKFSAAMAVLTPSESRDPRSSSTPHSMAPRPRATVARTSTDPGYENEHRQTVIRSTGAPGTKAAERVFVLRCGRCGTHYGSNARDIEQRKCPHCMDGEPGLTF